VAGLAGPGRVIAADIPRSQPSLCLQRNTR